MHLEHDMAVRLMTRLKRRHQKAFHLVRPVFLEGNVILHGEVASYHHRQICIEAAKQLQGVGEVRDRLRVDPLAFKNTQSLMPRRPIRTPCDRESFVKESIYESHLLARERRRSA